MAISGGREILRVDKAVRSQYAKENMMKISLISIYTFFMEDLDESWDS